MALNADRRNLLGDAVAEDFTSNDDRGMERAGNPGRRSLQQRLPAAERMQLFRNQISRDGPEPGSGPSAKEQGSDGDRQGRPARTTSQRQLVLDLGDGCSRGTHLSLAKAYATSRAGTATVRFPKLRTALLIGCSK